MSTVTEKVTEVAAEQEAATTTEAEGVRVEVVEEIEDVEA